MNRPSYLTRRLSGRSDVFHVCSTSIGPSGPLEPTFSTAWPYRRRLPNVTTDPPDPLGDAFHSILTAARAGAEWAWAAIYRDLGPTVLRYLTARNVPDAEDVLGEVFVQVVRHVGGFDGSEADFRAWVFAIARNRVIDEARRRGRHPVDPVETDVLINSATTGDAEDDALTAISGTEVRSLIQALTPDQRDVLLLRFFGQLTAEEVGRALGKSTGAVKTLQVRALAAIRRQLTRQGVSL